MLRVLFVPNNSREVKQFGYVRKVLGEGVNCQTLAISLNEKMKDLLQKEGFAHKNLKDYHTKNVVKVIEEEEAGIVITDFVSWEGKAFIHAANYMGIPALQLDDGIASDFSNLRKVSIPRVFLKVVKWLCKREKFLSFPYIFFTLWATSGSGRVTKATAMSLKVCKDGGIVDD